MKDQIQYLGPSILADNEMGLLMFIMTIIKYSDCCFSMIIDKKPDKITCHITPSKEEFRQDVINNLLYVNKIMKRKVIVFSKSLAISKKVSFEIVLSDQQ